MGLHPLFGFSSGQDFGAATQVIGQLEQAGLGLPDRDYYLKDDAKSIEIRAKYEDHVGKMLILANGATPNDRPLDTLTHPKELARTIVAFETELAKASMTRVDRRDPKKIYHRMKLAEIEQLA